MTKQNDKLCVNSFDLPAGFPTTFNSGRGGDGNTGEHNKKRPELKLRLKSKGLKQVLVGFRTRNYSGTETYWNHSK